MKDWISDWLYTLRAYPPFSRRRRELLEILADADDPDAWVEVDRP